MDQAAWQAIVQDTELLTEMVEARTPNIADKVVEAARAFMTRYADYLRWGGRDVTLYEWNPPYRGRGRLHAGVNAAHNLMVIQGEARWLRKTAQQALDDKKNHCENDAWRG